MKRMFNRNNIIVFFTSFIFIISLEIYFKPYTIDGIHFQEWSSDWVLQTLPIKQLKEYPVLSLWYLHIQPPLYDTFRMLIAQFIDSHDTSVLIKNVDKALYFIFALLYSFITTFIFLWVSRLTSANYGLLAAFIWILHPASIFYATLLETTLLSAFGFTWFLYELWRLKNNNKTGFVRLSISLLFIYFTKSIFQWYFIPVLIFSLLLLRFSIKSIFFSSIGISILIISLFITKQYILFNTTLTTTLNAGTHLCGMVWHNPTKNEINKANKILEFNYPKDSKKLSAKYKYGSKKYGNNEKSFKQNLIFSHICKNYFFEQPIKSLSNISKNFILSFTKFMRPSSSYRSNVIVDNLPWRYYYDFVFGKLFFLILIIISFFVWCLNKIIHKHDKKDILYSISIVIPILYFILIANIGGVHIGEYPSIWIETQRLKFIIEPILYIFIFVQLYNLSCLLYKVTNTFKKTCSRNNQINKHDSRKQ
jgi:hypothetical protein